MKKTIKILSLFLVLVCLVVGCDKNNSKENEASEYLKDITYEEVLKKIDNKDTFILEVVQTGCSNCTAFSPRFEAVLTEYEIVAYSLNITYLTSDENEDFLKEFDVDGTPTVIFFKDGKETSTLKRLVGNQDKDKIISKLKSNGYIED